MRDSYRATLERTFDELVGIGPRAHGSPGNHQASQFLEHTLSDLGLVVESIPFVAPKPRESDDAVLWLDSKGGVSIPSKAFLETVGGAVEGPLIRHGQTYVWGIHEWTVWRIGDPTAKAYIAARAEGPLIAQHLPEQSSPVPHVVVGPESVAELDEAAAERRDVRLEVPPGGELLEGRSLLAVSGHQRNDRRDAGPLVLGHFDTVPGTPGAYDNAAGAAAVVACAAALASGEIQCTTLLTSGEELGLAGARSYVARLRQAGGLDMITLALNLDGGGRGKLFEAWIGPESLQEIIAPALTDAIATREGYELIYRHPAPPGSDHQAFREVGVPAVMLSVNDLEILHRPEDVWDASKLGNARLLAEAAMALVPLFSRSLD